MADASKLKRKSSLGSPPPEEEASPNLHEPEIAPASSFLNLGQAAKETGKSRSVIYNALKSGRLRGKYNDKGEWEIDPAELFRVFSPQDVQEDALESEGTYKNAFLEFLREQLHDAKALANHAREREDQALERERESREREARLLLLLAIEQEARRSLEQKLLTAPVPTAKLHHAQWLLLGMLLTGAFGVGAYLLHGDAKTVEIALSSIFPPAAVETAGKPAPMSTVNSTTPQAASAETTPLLSPPPPQADAKTAVAALPAPPAVPPLSAPSTDAGTVNTPENLGVANAPESQVAPAAPAPPPSQPQSQPQPRPNGESTRQSWWWWWW